MICAGVPGRFAPQSRSRAPYGWKRWSAHRDLRMLYYPMEVELQMQCQHNLFLFPIFPKLNSKAWFSCLGGPMADLRMCLRVTEPRLSQTPSWLVSGNPFVNTKEWDQISCLSPCDSPARQVSQRFCEVDHAEQPVGACPNMTTDTTASPPQYHGRTCDSDVWAASPYSWYLDGFILRGIFRFSKCT